MLSVTNSHIRDKDIKFSEYGHSYTIKGNNKYKSVTTWLKTYFEKFDADLIIDKMMNSPKWPTNKYFGRSKQEIKELWRQSGDEAARLGTALHKLIEDFYNGKRVYSQTIEFVYFTDFTKDYNLTPYRTEWMVYDEELELAGSIDMVFLNDDKTVSIYDWKRCKSVEMYSDFNKYGLSPIQNIPDTNYWHYVIQLNTYKMILERNYELNVKELVLICMHPELDASYQKYVIPEINMDALINQRLQNKNK